MYVPYTYKQIARDSSDAVPLSLVKSHLRITGENSCEDELIRTYIDTAILCFEALTKRVLITTTFKTYRDIWERSYELRKSPFQSVESVQYYDTDNVLQTLDSSNYYTTDESGYSQLIFNNDASLPTLKDRKQAIEITFKAGYGDSVDNVPTDVKTALLQHVAQMYDNRGDCEGDCCENLLPPTAKMIYNKYRLMQIAIYENRC